MSMGVADGTEPDEVDQLVDAGLERYERGDVDGALRAWEEALALDPDETRASAYVDYVRENYEMLAGTPRGEVDVPFALAAVPGDAGHAAEPSLELEPALGAAGATAKVERYVESIDEGWFLDDEVPARLEPTPPTPAPAPLALDDPFAELELEPRPRASARQLPLPATLDAEITLELEADEPPEPGSEELGGLGELELDRPELGAGDDERTRDFARQGPWPSAGRRAETSSSTIDTGLPGMMPPPRLAPLAAGGARLDDTGDAPAFDDDDRLLTRPGRDGGGPLERGARSHDLAPEALAALSPTPRGGELGADERTRESPVVRVTFNLDTQDLTPPPPAEPGDDERTQERSAVLRSTPVEPGSDRRSYSPAPLAEPTHAGSLGSHPPLVIIEDAFLAGGGDVEPSGLDLADGAAFELGLPGSPMPPTAELRPPPDPHRAPTANPTVTPLSVDDLAPETRPARRTGRSSRPGATRPPLVPAVPTTELATRIDAEVDAGAPAGEARVDRTRRRVSDLIDRAVAASIAGDHATAIVALDLALAEEPDSAVAQKLVHRHQPAILDIYQRFLGDQANRPSLAMPMHELSGEKLDIRAAFLLSRIDGTLSFEEILDVSGMQRAEAFRHLANLVLRGILTVA